MGRSPHRGGKHLQLSAREPEGNKTDLHLKRQPERFRLGSPGFCRQRNRDAHARIVLLEKLLGCGERLPLAADNEMPAARHNARQKKIPGVAAIAHDDVAGPQGAEVIACQIHLALIELTNAGIDQ